MTEFIFNNNHFVQRKYFIDLADLDYFAKFRDMENAKIFLKIILISSFLRIIKGLKATTERFNFDTQKR